MRTSFILTSIFCFGLVSACQSPANEVEKYNTVTDSLNSKIAELENRIQLMEGLDNPSKVTIANTFVTLLTSQINNQEYQIKVSYPKSYFKSKNKKYPVLYVTDAETNFGGVSYIVQRLIKDKLIPEILVVGIAYDTSYKDFYRLRSRDLTPVEDPKLRLGGHDVDPTGGAPIFSEFLEKELFPFVEQEFRVQKDERAYYGHSYGGLFGSYVLLEKPNLFNKYILLGSSLWFNDKLMIQKAQNDSLRIQNKTSLYMGSGELEMRIDDYQTEFAGFLKSQNSPQLSIHDEVIPNETHRTIFGVGFTNGLRYIYRDELLK
ncbi:MAG: alpha/beta hydrolase [Flavobacteriales bacterium]|nr:alpha/beta hydrolase [Flavobacteriales bacterium]